MYLKYCIVFMFKKSTCKWIRAVQTRVVQASGVTARPALLSQILRGEN